MNRVDRWIQKFKHFNKITSYHDIPYLKMVQYILDNGEIKTDRTGTGTISIFGYQMRFDLSDRSIPLLTSKKIHTKSIIHELIWFLSGSTNIKYLTENEVTIWDEWANDNGELGPIYGYQWRRWENFNYKGSGDWKVTPIDQIAQLVYDIINNPDSRRLVVSAWNVGDISKMKLPPCHMMFQCYVVNGILSLQIYQRSCDTFLGVPFNIAQYSILLHLLASVTGLNPGELIWTGGDVHLYSNHLEQAQIQLERNIHPSPTITIDYKPSIFDYKYEDFHIHNYQSEAILKGDVAI